MHWFYRPEDTCLLVDKNMVKAKAKELAKADLAAWTKEKARCKAEKVPPPCCAAFIATRCLSINIGHHQVAQAGSTAD